MNDLLVIIVVYNFAAAKLPYINSLKNTQILVYDNSPTPQIVPEHIHYYHNAGNPGVSEAYNYGFELAEKLGLHYCLLLDQDSSFDQSMLDEYRKLQNKYGDQMIYAPIVSKEDKIYSPFIELWYKNMYQTNDNFEYQEIYSLNHKSLINSGLMIPLSIVEEVGGFNDRIKLDFSDTYFMENYREKYPAVILVPVRIQHSISGDEGSNSEKELSRFRYFCNGAREMKKSTKDKARISRLIAVRTLRLMMKYKTLYPLQIAAGYYRRNKTI